jgi:hypothetical protein
MLQRRYFCPSFASGLLTRANNFNGLSKFIGKATALFWIKRCLGTSSAVWHERSTSPVPFSERSFCLPFLIFHSSGRSLNHLPTEHCSFAVSSIAVSCLFSRKLLAMLMHCTGILEPFNFALVKERFINDASAHRSIVDAHKGTFDWIFKKGKSPFADRPDSKNGVSG